MTSKFFFAAAMGLAALLPAQQAFAGAKDYEFQAVSPEVKTGASRDVAVRLIRKATSEPISGAVLIRTRLDMSPENMGDMTAKLVTQKSSEPGIYKFKGDFDMAGAWALKLMAKVPGESETVEGTVIVKAKD